MGPLQGVRVLEFGGIGPGPFTAMLLSRLGADVLRLRRPGETSPLGTAGARADRRGRPAVTVDLKSEFGQHVARTLARSADASIEGFRPGVMERLGLGPDVLLLDNPRLVYGRVTGYGQTGPLAQSAGHDINYLAISGVLGAVRREGERPLFPLNLLGDYGGGGMLLAVGLLCGILEARQSGRGQVVDASIVEGVAQLGLLIFGLIGDGSWGNPGTNALDSGAPFYEVYETSDGGFVAVGAIEPEFYAALLSLLGIDPAEAPQWDRTGWPSLKVRFAEIFRSRSRDAWTSAGAGVDACVTPVLLPTEAPLHPSNLAREVFYKERDGSYVPAAAPRFGHSNPTVTSRPTPAHEALEDWGVTGPDIETLRTLGCFTE